MKLKKRVKNGHRQFLRNEKKNHLNYIPLQQTLLLVRFYAKDTA